MALTLAGYAPPSMSGCTSHSEAAGSTNSSPHFATFGLGQDGLAVTARDNGRVRKTTFDGGPWKTAKEKAGAETATFHWLRHYYANLLSASTPALPRPDGNQGFVAALVRADVGLIADQSDTQMCENHRLVEVHCPPD